MIRDTTRLLCSARGFLLVLSSAIFLVHCSDSGPDPDARPRSDGQVVPGQDRGPDRGQGTADSGGGGGFNESLQRACQRIVANCQGESDPMGGLWSSMIVPWTQQACEQIAHCYVEATAEKCFERLATYYICIEKLEPFSCAGCLNQWQYIQGACPCLKQCNPACP